MPLDEIEKGRPHLRDTLEVYRKVLEFDELMSRESISLSAGDVAYPADSVAAVFDAFSSVFDLPGEMLAPLREEVKLGRVDFRRLPLNETPAFSLPYHEDELREILFLVSRPYFVRLGTSSPLRSRPWERGRCPVCDSSPSLSFLKQNEGRTLSCSWCGSRGKWKRIGCPHCGNSDTGKLDIIEIEDEKGMRIDLCNGCRTYVKTADDNLLMDYTPELIDLISMPLDVLAQDRGYRRLSPNAIGMRELV
ncbi:MAG: formate dehydrogenase accessory protein FdhE [Nitrospirae bacterium]|nr:formate dehydrogenase accessory protein FdhE [Nitrospirota bacterium]